jgi:hypothetical protein
MARIVVCGYMIRHPVAGMLLAYFHYLLGLHRLGHEVFYFEESGWSGSCYDPVANTCSDDPQPGLRILQDLMASCNVTIPVCYVNRDSGQVRGVNWLAAKDVFRRADLLLNVGGTCWLPEFCLTRRRALIDMDPLFTQLGRFGAEGLNEHQVHFSYGGNIGQPDCTIPDAGIDWLPIAPPVVTEIWEPSSGTPRTASKGSIDAPFTTIANWTAYGGITYRGEHYGQKDEEFARLQGLPGYTSQKLELAVSGGSVETMEGFRSSGWYIRNGGEVSADVSTYRNYIISSRGELSAAKNAYVKTRSGWFSDRSVCYLAAGLPVILQNTGFTDWLPAGTGLLAFSSVEEAADCLDRVNADYAMHCAAAAEIAHQTFRHSVVLPKILEACCV